MIFTSKLILLFIFISLLGCSVQTIAVKTTGSLLMEASNEIETEANYEMFVLGVPGNIKTIEGLLYLDPTNSNLLLAATKAYAGYAFIANETQYLDDKLSEKDNSKFKNQALLNYSKAVNYGLRMLQSWGVDVSQMMGSTSRSQKLNQMLSSSLSGSNEQVEGVFFLAQAYGSLINLQRSNITLLGHLPLVKALFDWTCGLKPEQHFGACGQFYGAYESGRPAMLGGNPQKGKEVFLDLIQKYPFNLSHRIAYIQYYVIPMMDEKEYKLQKKSILELAKKFESSLFYDPSQKSGENVFLEANPKLRLYNAMALKRLEIINKYSKDIF